MKQLLIFWVTVGLISCCGTTAIRIYKYYETLKMDKEFSFEIQQLSKRGDYQVLDCCPPDYNLVSIVCCTEGGHVIYEKDESFVCIEVRGTEVLVLRRNPDARFIIKVRLDEKVGMEILEQVDSPTIHRFTLLENSNTEL